MTAEFAVTLRMLKSASGYIVDALLMSQAQCVITYVKNTRGVLLQDSWAGKCLDNCPTSCDIKFDCDCVRKLCFAVGRYSCRTSNPCSYENIFTNGFGYYYPHYNVWRYVHCGAWDPDTLYSTCTEYRCPRGTVWDQTNTICTDPDNVGISKCFLSYYRYCSCTVASFG